ncbi:hypothetical protein SAMN05660297_02572 [Natronincola peptidivorans]|uniref:Uncharacterized protein n=1 Tax=Natronincola peptidivorans TaxID=426128 RepID=A0A1I0EWF9_9FIRM|nr:hypothetical protein [Natronincola peptidivorans]SET49487.1 hypothetical protein SAMN05660297_02572 [Natronincola peptidivorans]
MGKKLITINMVEQMFNDGIEKLYINDKVIVSPGARDYAHEKGIKVIYGKEKIEESDDLIARITEILENSYEITEEDIIKKITCSVVDIIQS